MVRLVFVVVTVAAAFSGCFDYEPHDGGPCREPGRLVCSGDMRVILQCDFTEAGKYGARTECAAAGDCDAREVRLDAGEFVNGFPYEGSHDDRLVRYDNGRYIEFYCRAQ